MRARKPKPRRRTAGHASRPGPPLRTRLRRVLPAPGRILPVMALALLIAGLVVVVNGPWLRVARVAWAGQQYTASYELQRTADRLKGTPLLALDAARLEAQLERLPAVAHARVEALLPDRLQITLAEKQPAFVWQTEVVRLVGAADGTLIGQLALGADLPESLASLPLVDDRRVTSRQVIVGDQIEPSMLATALRLAAVDPAQIMSSASGFDVRLDDEHGFLLVARDAAWQAALGLYRVDASEDPSHPGDRIDAQLAAIRTLFTLQPEVRVSWIDVRNPGKVYWRP